MNNNDIVWNASFGGTALVGQLDGVSFVDLIAKLESLGATNDANPDGPYENFFRFSGTFKGEKFTLYDKYSNIRIGGTPALDVAGLTAALIALLGKGQAGMPLSPEVEHAIAVEVNRIFEKFDY